MALTTLEKCVDRTPAVPNKTTTMKALVYQAVGKKVLVDRPKLEIAATTDPIVRIAKRRGDIEAQSIAGCARSLQQFSIVVTNLSL